MTFHESDKNQGLVCNCSSMWSDAQTVSRQKNNKENVEIVTKMSSKRHLFFDDSNCGVSDVEQDGGPVLFPCGGHQTVYRSVYHVHS